MCCSFSGLSRHSFHIFVGDSRLCRSCLFLLSTFVSDALRSSCLSSVAVSIAGAASALLPQLSRSVSSIVLFVGRFVVFEVLDLLGVVCL